MRARFFRALSMALPSEILAASVGVWGFKRVKYIATRAFCICHMQHRVEAKPEQF